MTNAFTNPDTLRNPYPFFCELRHERPVYFDQDIGAYVVTRYDDVNHVLRHASPFSSAAKLFGAYRYESVVADILSKRGCGPFYPILSKTDPPEHSRFRQALNLVFSAQRVVKLQDYIDDLIRELIDGFIDKGEVEVMSALAVPLPVTVIAHLLSVPREQAMDIKRWTNAYTACVGNRLASEASAVDAAETLVEMQNFIMRHVEQRRHQQRDDVLTDILNAKSDDGRSLSEREIVSVCASFMAAGHENVSMVILYLIKVLAENPRLVDDLRHAENSEKACKAFIEEALRLYAPTRFLPRMVAEDTRLNGIEIPQGSLVFVAMASANVDDRMFGQAAGEFRQERSNAGRHLTFGAGPHTCLGNVLARAELRSLLRAVIERIGNIRLAHRDFPESDFAPLIFGINVHLKKLDITFEKVPAEVSVSA